MTYRMKKLFFLSVTAFAGLSISSCKPDLDSFTIDDSTPPATSIVNPYEGVDFSTTLRLKANLHTHTNRSDGNRTADEMIKDYADRAYDIVAITDHENRYHKNTGFVHISGRKVLVICGSEITMTHHFNALFTDQGKAFDLTVKEAMKTEIKNANSILFLNHPGMHTWFYPIGFYFDLYRTLPKENFIGQEVINGQDAFPIDKKIWDWVLTDITPSRNVYGFANDDSHSLAETGYSYNELLVDEFNESKVREAIQNGISFFYSKSTVKNPKGALPYIKKVIINPYHLTIEIEAENYSNIEWISCGHVVSIEPIIYMNRNSSRNYNLSRYVRFILTGAGGQLFSQPFLIL